MYGYKLQIWHERRWKWGIKDYASLEQAEQRIVDLKAVGIKARVKPAVEFYT